MSCLSRWTVSLSAASLWLAGMPAAFAQDDTDYDSNRILGIGMQRMPAWPGADDHRNEVVPFVHMELPWHITLSTVDGVTMDLIHADGWHGGLYGNYQWGRDRSELTPAPLEAMNAFSPRISMGGFVAYQFNHWLDAGTDLSHDTQGAGAYWRVYAVAELPAIGYWMHEFELQWQGMNGPAMRRYFGVTPVQAAALGTAAWQPGSGSQQGELTYSAFMPTSLHTGFALSLNYARLLGPASDSPLVRRYGSPNQLTGTLAFVYRFL